MTKKEAQELVLKTIEALADQDGRKALNTLQAWLSAFAVYGIEKGEDR